VGPDVTFTQPVHLTNSLVFSGTSYVQAGEHDRIIAHRDSIIQCQQVEVE